MTSNSKQADSPRKPMKLKSLSPPIHRLLSKLRSRIRRYVFIEGLAAAVIWLVLTFWIALAIDYFPVMFGFAELSRPARAILLVVAALIIGYVLYRMVFRRVFVSMKNRSMAILIERRYSEFNDSLLTTVDRTTANVSDVPVDESMLERTRLDAESHLKNVDLDKVVNRRPLTKAFVVAGLLLLSVAGFSVAKPDTMKLACQRLYLLDQSTWPRQCQIELVGIKVKRENPVEGIEELGQMILPVDGVFKIAKGSTLTLMVRAESESEEENRKLPSTCSLIYQIKDGERGTQAFKRIGSPRNGFQLYSLDGQPLQGVLSNLSFSIRGGDHRLGPFEIQLADEPYVSETILDCKYPEYLSSDLRYWDEEIRWTGQAKLAMGTSITLKGSSQNSLKRVYAFNRTTETMSSIEPTRNKFEFKIPPISDSVQLQFFLCDTNGLVSETPHTVNIEMIEDQPPMVQTRLNGIGTAVTPDVRIPFNVTVTDDKDLKEVWLEIEVAETETLTVPLEISRPDSNVAIDFKKRKREIGQQYDLPPGEDNTVALVFKASDKFNLGTSPNIGIGDRYVLDIVDANELIRILERLEVDQRRRLEQIYQELGDTRNYLLRTKSALESSGERIVEPGDRRSDKLDGNAELEDEEEDGSDDIRKQEMQLLFSQRAIIQIDKSKQEILGSAAAFDNIRLQLINNRIDSEDRKTRFTDKIIEPLRLIGSLSMRQLREQAAELESSLRDLQISPNDETISDAADDLANVAIEKTDQVIKELNEVLDVLIKYETQNELLEIVRQMIKSQKELMERTKKERQRKAFEGLLD